MFYFFFYFFFYFLKGPGFASHCFSIGVLLLALLELGSCRGQQRIKQEVGGVKHLHVLANAIFLRKNCVYVVLSLHVECSYLILYLSYVVTVF